MQPLEKSARLWMWKPWRPGARPVILKIVVICMYTIIYNDTIFVLNIIYRLFKKKIYISYIRADIIRIHDYNCNSVNNQHNHLKLISFHVPVFNDALIGILLSESDRSSGVVPGIRSVMARLSLGGKLTGSND